MTEKKPMSMLCIGDSYTIGEMVLPEARFPEQTISVLKKNGIEINELKIIAKTGWTTDELEQAIETEKMEGTFDLVTLLIGVNNQYRGRDLSNYKAEFKNLLNKAIAYAAQKPSRVYVLSIPDWGVTPFAVERDRNAIAIEIDMFNAVNMDETKKCAANYIDITDISREAANNRLLIAEDHLHPSGIMYSLWAQRLAALIQSTL